MNGLIQEGFLLSCFAEVKSHAPDSELGNWGHFTNIASPWLE
jgi:hypothetical protein